MDPSDPPLKIEKSYFGLRTAESTVSLMAHEAIPGSNLGLFRS